VKRGASYALAIVGIFSLPLASASPAASEQAEYVIGAQDILTVAVHADQGLSGQYRVDADGTISFPLVGKVKAAGLTVPGVEAALEARLVAAEIFKNPEVTVTVETYRSQRIFVVGLVDKPGTYPLRGDTLLLEALAQAGSVGASAGDEIIIVRPRQGGEAQGPVLPDQPDVASVERVDLRRLQSGELSHGPKLRDGDTIFVPRAESAYVFGQVRSPGVYPVQKDTTVLQALSLAGGVTDRGATNRIRIVRMVDGKRKEINVKLSDLVLPGDTIIVRERLF
jgi:polysaccharide biosynthesis/export protein